MTDPQQAQPKKVTVVGTLPNGSEILQIPILVSPNDVPVRWEDL